MGTLTFLFESLRAIQNNLLRQQKLLVNCHRTAVSAPQSTAPFPKARSSGLWKSSGDSGVSGGLIEWPPCSRLAVSALDRGQTKPFASKYSIFFGPGPSLSCFSILPHSKTNTGELRFNRAYFYPDLHIPWVRLYPGNGSSCTINLIFWVIEG